jgi:hypothetical protein
LKIIEEEVENRQYLPGNCILDSLKSSNYVKPEVKNNIRGFEEISNENKYELVSEILKNNINNNRPIDAIENKIDTGIDFLRLSNKKMKTLNEKNDGNDIKLEPGIDLGRRSNSKFTYNKQSDPNDKTGIDLGRLSNNKLTTNNKQTDPNDNKIEKCIDLARLSNNKLINKKQVEHNDNKIETGIDLGRSSNNKLLNNKTAEMLENIVDTGIDLGRLSNNKLINKQIDYSENKAESGIDLGRLSNNKLLNKQNEQNDNKAESGIDLGRLSNNKLLNKQIDQNENKQESGIDLGRLSNNKHSSQNEQYSSNPQSFVNKEINEINPENNYTPSNSNSGLGLKRRSTGIIKKKIIKSATGSISKEIDNNRDFSNMSRDVNNLENGKNEEKTKLTNTNQDIPDMKDFVSNPVKKVLSFNEEEMNNLNFSQNRNSVEPFQSTSLSNYQFNTNKINQFNLHTPNESKTNNNGNSLIVSNYKTNNTIIETRSTHNNFRLTNTNSRPDFKHTKLDIPRGSNKVPLTKLQTNQKDRKTSIQLQVNNFPEFLDKRNEKKYTLKEDILKNANSAIKVVNSIPENKEEIKIDNHITKSHESIPNVSEETTIINNEENTLKRRKSGLIKLPKKVKNDDKENEEFFSTPVVNTEYLNTVESAMDNSKIDIINTENNFSETDDIAPSSKVRIDFDTYQDLPDIDENSGYDDVEDELMDIFDEKANINEIKHIYRQTQKEFVEKCADSIENVRKESATKIVRFF